MWASGDAQDNGGILGGVMALMGTPGAQDVCFMAPWYRQNKLVGKSWYRFILKPWQLDFSLISSFISYILSTERAHNDHHYLTKF